MSRARRLLAVLALLASPASALELGLPSSAVLARDEAEPLASHALAVGPWAGGVLPLRQVEGQVRRQVWQIPGSDRTTLQILAPLREQIVAQGYRTILECGGEACGGFDFRAGLEILPPPAMFADLVDFRYLAAEREGEALSLLVSRGGERGFVQLVRVAAAPEELAAPAPVSPPAALAEPPSEDLGARLERDGRVVLDGLAFASGSADLAPGDERDLAALAAYLAANPGRRVAVVGHTDAQGALPANVALSRRRAEAVVGRLVSGHGAEPARLVAEGMGWLAPRATNLTPEGRQANRRVEAVVLP